LGLNFQQSSVVIEHLIDLPLAIRKKHTLYGFILKWHGGYPVNNLNDDFDRTLKLVQKEFLSFPDNTPEKEFCKADQAMRNRFEKMGIAFTTAINHNIDVKEILAAMGDEEARETIFHDFHDLFNDAVNRGILGNFTDRKQLLIAQSASNYQFNTWLQTHKNWEYRNEEQYLTYLNRDTFDEFLAQKNTGLTNVVSSTTKVIPKITMRQIALICHYTDRTVTRETAKSIVKEYSLTSGDALFNHYTYYRSKANRIGIENTKKKNDNKVQLLESVLGHFSGNATVEKLIKADISSLKEAINKSE
jgi:hypothetical protein